METPSGSFGWAHTHHILPYPQRPGPVVIVKRSEDGNNSCAGVITWSVIVAAWIAGRAGGWRAKKICRRARGGFYSGVTPEQAAGGERSREIFGGERQVVRLLFDWR